MLQSMDSNSLALLSYSDTMVSNISLIYKTDLHITEAEPKLGNSEGGAVVKVSF
jgi:hypothetical protein